MFGKPSDLSSDRKKEKSVVSFTHGQNIICSQTNWTTLRMSRPLFVDIFCKSRGGLSSSEKEKNLQRMIILFTLSIECNHF